MPISHTAWTRRLRRPLLLAIVLMTGTAFAADGPVLLPLPSAAEVHAQATEAYWTPERMGEALPTPFPRVTVTGTEVAISPQAGLPVEASPGFALGWRPGRAPQPDAGSRIEITPDNPLYQVFFGGEQPQTSPPFSPPSTPTDYGNYAPFNRFTWHDGAYLVYPMSAVGKLFFTQRGQNFVCSASVIQKNTLATAGHCLHDGSNDPAGWSTNLLFCPSYNQTGVNPARGCWVVVGAVTSWQWYSAGNSDRDYACLITLPTGTTISNSVGNVTGWTARAWNWPSRQSTFAWGYPAGAPFPGNRLVTVASTEWYQLNQNTGESQLSKYIGSDMTGGSSGGPWWWNMVYSGTEFSDTDGSGLTDPFQGLDFPVLNGVNSHRRCTQANCPAGTLFTQEMGSPQFLHTTTDPDESEDVFALCFANGGA
jgi:V8-like Glu-specific endopeptidase